MISSIEAFGEGYPLFYLFLFLLSLDVIDDFSEEFIDYLLGG
jgi:hypothetical protein